MSENKLTLEVYSSGTTRINDPKNILGLASGIKFDTQYPGGLYGSASFFLPDSTTNSPLIRGGYRVVIRNGLDIVYEGWVLDRTFQFGDTTQGLPYECIGGFGQWMMRRYWRKQWADTRVDADTWSPDTSANIDLCMIDRNSRLKFTPKAEAWALNDYMAVVYTMPTGETIKKITFDYDLTGANFRLSFYDTTNGTHNIATTPGSGTGASYTLATPANQVKLNYVCTSATTPTSDGSYYGQISNVTVYSETSSINLTEIFTDVVGKLNIDGVLNSDVSNIGNCTTSIVPFITDGWMRLSDIVEKAAHYGDVSYNPWAYGVLASEKALTPNGTPVAFAEAYPDTTTGSFDYQVMLDGANVVAPLAPRQDFSELYNWIIVEYQDGTGKAQYVTPDDDGNLKNTSSINRYGQSDYVLSVGPATQTLAIDNGRRFLSRHAWPVWKCDGGIGIIGYILDSVGQPIPTSNIRAGKLLYITNFLEDLTSNGDNKLVLMISQASYDDDTQTCALQFGKPDLLMTNALFSFPVTWNDAVPTPNQQEAGQGGRGRLNWKRQYGIPEGSALWNEAVRLGKTAFLAKYPNMKRKRKN